MNYNFADAWILNSIYFSEEENDGARLVNIIGHADYTNHAIIEFGELNDSLKKLLQDDLIIALKDGNLKSTKAYNIWIKKKIENKSRIQVFKLIEDTQVFLAKLKRTSSEKSLNQNQIISKLEYEYALKEYLKKVV